MSNQLVLARKLKLPLNAVTQKFAFVARSGAGKTYAAGRLAEEMHRVNGQFVVLDPVGVWYGLRISADGKGPGISIPVFGGHHADIPITHENGKALAELIIEKRLSAVLDVSLMRKNNRNQFVTDFVEVFYHQKKLNKGPVHVFIEEAHTFAPQRTSPDTAKMLGAFEDLCRLGRNFGIGYSLISQRPQAVHKDILNQVECLVALQTTGPHERKAIKEWVVDRGLKENLVEELPELEIGEAYIWSPQWLKILAKYKILTKKTYDASATPEFDEASVASDAFAPIDLDSLRQAFATVAKDSAKDDPVFLKKRVRELEFQLTQAKLNLENAHKQPEVRVPLLVDQDVKLLQRVDRMLQQVLAKADGLTPVAPEPETTPTPEPVEAPKPVKVMRKKRTKDASQIKKGAVTMLKVMVQLGGATRSQLALMCGIKPTGSTLTSYLSALRTNEMIEETGDTVYINTAGRRYLEEINQYPETAVTHAQLVALWKPKLKKGARDMLDYLIKSYPEEVHREELADHANISSSGSTLTSYLSMLRSAGLIDESSGKMVKAHKDLWPSGGVLA